MPCTFISKSVAIAAPSFTDFPTPASSRGTYRQRRGSSSKRRPILANAVLHHHQSQSKRGEQLRLLQLNHLLQYHQALRQLVGTPPAMVTTTTASATLSLAVSDMDGPGAVKILLKSKDKNEKSPNQSRLESKRNYGVAKLKHSLVSVNISSTEPKTVPGTVFFRLEHCPGFPASLFIFFLKIPRSNY